jgi:RNA polymerase sigma-70 factor (ECF subfamily)
MRGIQTDEQLLRGALQGRRDDFGILTQRYYGLVYGIAFSYTGNPSDAEDLSQESFLKAYRSLDTLRDLGRFRAWLTRIARNECHNWQARRKHEKSLADAEQTHDAAVTSDVEKKELFEFLWSEIGGLNEPSREILTVYYFHGRNAREVAQRLDISVSAVEKRLQRARRLLGERLASRLDDALEPHRPNADTAKQTSLAVIAIPVAWDSAKVSALLGTAEAVPALTNVVLWITVVAIVGTLSAMLYGEHMRRRLVTTETSEREIAEPVSATASLDSETGAASVSLRGDSNVSQTNASDQRPDFLVRVCAEGTEKEPIENATVTLFAPAKNDLRAVTDAKGEARYEQAPLGYTALAVEHPHYLTERLRYTRFAHGGVFEVTLKPGKPFRGTVVSAVSGEPISDFVLELTGIDPPQTTPWRDGPVAFHGTQGKFAIWKIEDAERLIVRAPAFIRSDVSLSELNDWQDIAVRLNQAPVVEGRVQDRQGRAISGAQVGFVSAAVESFAELGFRNVALTDDDGNYQVSWEDNPKRILTALHAGFAPHTEYILEDMRQGRRIRRDITLNRIATLHGIVWYDGEPVENAQVSGGPDMEPVRTDTRGQFSMEGLAPGARTIVAVLPSSYGELPEMKRNDRTLYGMLRKGEIVDLQEGAETEITFDFQTPEAMATLTGFLDVTIGEAESSPDQRYNHGRVTVVVHRNDGVYSNTQWTGVDRPYRIEGLPSGRATVTAEVGLPTGVDLLQEVELDIPESGEVRCSFTFAPASVIRGQVRDIPFGHWAGLTFLQGAYTHEDLTHYLPVCGSQSLAASGAYAFGPIEAGTYTVVVLLYSERHMAKPSVGFPWNDNADPAKWTPSPGTHYGSDWSWFDLSLPPSGRSVSIVEAHTDSTPPPTLAVVTVGENQTVELNLNARH